MANYTLTLRSEEDYRLMKKLLKDLLYALPKIPNIALKKLLKRSETVIWSGLFAPVDDFMKELVS